MNDFKVTRTCVAMACLFLFCFPWSSAGCVKVDKFRILQEASAEVRGTPDEVWGAMLGILDDRLADVHVLSGHECSAVIDLIKYNIKVTPKTSPSAVVPISTIIMTVDGSKKQLVETVNNLAQECGVAVSIGQR